MSYENWLRLIACIDFAGKSLCHEILHKKEKLPSDGAQLYTKLEIYKSEMHYQIYEEILCPPSKIIDENKFNLLIYTAVIHLMIGDKYDELIYDVRDMRNKIFHMKDVSCCTTNFEQLWSEACDMLSNHGFDVNLIKALRNCHLTLEEEYKGSLKFSSF